MTNYGSNEPINMFGILTLSNLAFGNDDNRARIGQKGGCDCILNAMECFNDNVKLQGAGCVALTNVAHSDDNNKRIIVKKGGLEMRNSARRVKKSEPRETKTFETP